MGERNLLDLSRTPLLLEELESMAVVNASETEGYPQYTSFER